MCTRSRLGGGGCCWWRWRGDSPYRDRGEKKQSSPAQPVDSKTLLCLWLTEESYWRLWRSTTPHFSTQTALTELRGSKTTDICKWLLEGHFGERTQNVVTLKLLLLLSSSLFAQFHTVLMKRWNVSWHSWQLGSVSLDCNNDVKCPMLLVQSLRLRVVLHLHSYRNWCEYF